MPAPKGFSKTAKEAYEYVEELGSDDPRAIIDAVVRWYAERQDITDEAEVDALSGMIQRVAEWESNLGESPSGDNEQSWGLFHAHFQGRGAGYTEEELLDPILNTIISVEELLPLGHEAYLSDPTTTADVLVRKGQRPDPENVEAVNNMVAHVGGADGTITAQQTTPTEAPYFPGAGRTEYINACMNAGHGQVKCGRWARQTFPSGADAGDTTDAHRYALRQWNQSNPDQTVTIEEVKTAARLWPDVPLMAAIRKFTEATADVGPEGEEAVKVTDADRRRVWELGLDLTDAEIKEAKRQGIPFEDYALLKETAERLGISSAKLAQALTAAGQDPEAVRAVLDRLEGEAKLADATARVQAARPGMTEAEARAYAEQGLAAGAEPEEIGYAAKNNVPVETLLSLKQQLDQIAEGAADPRTVPTLTDAIEGWTNQQTPQQVAQRRRFEAEVQPWLRRLEGIAERLGKTPQEVYVAARTLGRGDVRAGLEELLKIDARRRKPGETTAEYAQRRIAEGASRKEIQRSLRAQLGEEPSMWEPATGLRRERYQMRAARERRGAVEPKYGMPFGTSRQLSRYGETMYTAGLAETYLRTTGPLGTQTQAEWEQQQEAVRGNYPELARRVAEEPLEEMAAGAPSAAPTAAGGAQELTRSTALGTEDVFGPTPRPEDEQLEEDNRQLRRARARA